MRPIIFQGIMGRSFKNHLSDYKPGTVITIDKSKFARYTKQTLDRILKDESALKKPSVYTGELYWGRRNSVARVNLTNVGLM